MHTHFTTTDRLAELLVALWLVYLGAPGYDILLRLPGFAGPGLSQKPEESQGPLSQDGASFLTLLVPGLITAGLRVRSTKVQQVQTAEASYCLTQSPMCPVPQLFSLGVPAAFPPPPPP